MPLPHQSMKTTTAKPKLKGRQWGKNETNAPTPFWSITRLWIDATLKEYKGKKPDELTQVFARGPFAGWSEREVKELAERMDNSWKGYPLWKMEL